MSSAVLCENLTKRYGNKEVLKSVTFELEVGEPVALVGPNGAGKTTLFSILCGYLQPSSGVVSLFGEAPGSTKLVGAVSALPQDALLDPAMNLHKQLSFFGRLQGFSKLNAGIEASRVLELMQLSDAVYQLPSELSHGMRKRAAIAQALIGSPKLVFLDEPTAGLDPANARNIRQAIMGLSDSTTFVISSHNLQELERLCHTILYLKQGQLEQETTGQHHSEWGFLTIVMSTSTDGTEVSAAMQGLNGVERVEQSSKNEFLVQYHHEAVPEMDQMILKMLAEKGWSYRQLTRGKSLEDRLFS